jgi:hypothetical protein
MYTEMAPLCMKTSPVLAIERRQKSSKETRKERKWVCSFEAYTSEMSAIRHVCIKIRHERRDMSKKYRDFMRAGGRDAGREWQ